MSLLTIINFGSTGLIEGQNMAPPPERPTGSQAVEGASATHR